MKPTVFILLLFSSQILFGQKIENVNFNQKNDTVFEISYDISDAKPEQLFIVRLHYTTDGGKNLSDSLKFVTGDVGNGITGGKGKTIIWEAFKETKKLNGKTIKFDVKARISNTYLKNETGKIEYDSLKASDNVENKDEAIVFYLKAIDGARKSNTDILYTNLRSAINIDTSLKAKAKTEMEFAKYFEDDTFKSIVYVRKFKSQNETGTFIDKRDGKVYKWVKIGEQVWMAENLNFKTDKGSWCYKDSTKYCDTYGQLYNWETAKKACPSGWHLPSDAEWEQLFLYLGEGYNSAKMKSTDSWNSPNVEATNESGFSALPGGYRKDDGKYTGIGNIGGWWSATPGRNCSTCYTKYLNHENNGIFGGGSKIFDYNIRCVKNK